ncbi:uncharacterized protein M421DRAFT_176379 [Didymella exigua CBS 183.55]|uniref:Uncharacterized protein n=1 Tax=Didymella exigua CBS 183.55 TaxID=1150837 RepID=A0A6A5RP51_9PLEO|nr:uncharacterized protein M421DRAFT_176379 [Didymella exigua CBS 183.55]KAF1927297.1 hypothetical protein M421DRAFT_176379 [Didymella exigua CBS 183.55]
MVVVRKQTRRGKLVVVLQSVTYGGAILRPDKSQRSGVRPVHQILRHSLMRSGYGDACSLELLGMEIMLPSPLRLAEKQDGHYDCTDCRIRQAPYEPCCALSAPPAYACRRGSSFELASRRFSQDVMFKIDGASSGQLMGERSTVRGIHSALRVR